MARRTQVAAAKRTRRRAPATRRRTRSPAKPRGRKRGVSTREYGLRVAPKSSPRSWNYAYSKGAGPDRGKRPSYPIVPKARARAARSYAARRNTAGSLRTVDATIRARYGSVRAIYRGRGGVTGRKR